MMRSTLAVFTGALGLLVLQTPLFEPVRTGPPVEERGVSRGAAWGDFDDDGDPDLFVTRPTYVDSTQTNHLYRNDGARGFTRVDVPLGDPGTWEGATWVDVDGDHDLDLHVVGRNGSGTLFFENDGAGALSLLPDVLPHAQTQSASMGCWADANGDGLLDVFTIGYGAGRNALFRNAGSWQFMSVALPADALGDGSARACAWGDLDGDGLPEIVVANARRSNLLLRNRGGMRLEPDTTTALQRDTAYGYGASFTDVNGDGLRDLFIANFDADNTLYLGRSGGELQAVPLDERLQSAATKGHAWGDFDLDGHVDAYLGSGTPGPAMLNRVFLGGAELRFTLQDHGEFAEHSDTSAAVALADYDLDGDVDVFVANWGSSGSVNRLYRNTTTDRNWLRVHLEGVRSNRMGVGARVSVLVQHDSGARWQHRWLDAATGYAGQNEPVLHFGIGNARQADSLIVHWPSGHVDRAGSVPASRSVRVRESAGVIDTH